jgi:uncharacterized protein YegP (UPF0339 family)
LPLSLRPIRGEGALEKAAKFIIYRGWDGGYRWRLRSLAGETIAASEIGHQKKAGCEQEMERWRTMYPDTPVRDATIRSFKKQSSLKS